MLLLARENNLTSGLSCIWKKSNHFVLFGLDRKRIEIVKPQKLF